MTTIYLTAVEPQKDHPVLLVDHNGVDTGWWGQGVRVNEAWMIRRYKRLWEEPAEGQGYSNRPNWWPHFSPFHTDTWDTVMRAAVPFLVVPRKLQSRAGLTKATLVNVWPEGLYTIAKGWRVAHLSLDELEGQNLFPWSDPFVVWKGPRGWFQMAALRLAGPAKPTWEIEGDVFRPPVVHQVEKMLFTRIDLKGEDQLPGKGTTCRYFYRYRLVSQAPMPMLRWASDQTIYVLLKHEQPAELLPREVAGGPAPTPVLTLEPGSWLIRYPYRRI